MEISTVIGVLAAVWIGYLVLESAGNRRSRRQVEHVVHVNGTRGKSSTSRLIEAGLRAGGLRVFCKTTGTDPMTIDVEGREEPVVRRGRANIREQIGILRRAAEQKAQVLVVECMALQPELQRTSQHRILCADIGVITNVRRDHTDVMGETLPEICDCLCSTVPKKGILFTAEEGQAARMRACAEKSGTEFRQVRPAGDEPDFDFPENIALALAVCEYLGVDRETALAGMAGYRRDPYALSILRMGRGIYVDGLSINDVQSVCLVWEQLCAKYGWQERRLILLINNRADRGSRTEDMLKVCLALKPAEVWLMGAAGSYMQRNLRRKLPSAAVTRLKGPEEADLTSLEENSVIYAVGNIAQGGRALAARAREEGRPFV